MAPTNAQQQTSASLSIVKDVASDPERQRILIHTEALAQSKIPVGEGVILKTKVSAERAKKAGHPDVQSAASMARFCFHSHTQTANP